MEKFISKSGNIICNNFSNLLNNTVKWNLYTISENIRVINEKLLDELYKINSGLSDGDEKTQLFIKINRTLDNIDMAKKNLKLLMENSYFDRIGLGLGGGYAYCNY